MQAANANSIEHASFKNDTIPLALVAPDVFREINYGYARPRWLAPNCDGIPDRLAVSFAIFRKSFTGGILIDALSKYNAHTRPA